MSRYATIKRDMYVYAILSTICTKLSFSKYNSFHANIIYLYKIKIYMKKLCLQLIEIYVDGHSFKVNRKERVADYGNLICTRTFSSCNYIHILFAKYHKKGKTYWMRCSFQKLKNFRFKTQTSLGFTAMKMNSYEKMKKRN